ncbi:hypothetical protein [Microcoleus sp. FACHB-68]|uniref:hypothetical protein n=1 Tax=Microcoleus sp. FACHB-68 TaxID=2692826 RepID=UPI001688ABFA|nr:hypothetical protein [Microcoleus sp. FACHB-68]
MIGWSFTTRNFADVAGNYSQIVETLTFCRRIEAFKASTASLRYNSPNLWEYSPLTDKCRPEHPQQTALQIQNCLNFQAQSPPLLSRTPGEPQSEINEKLREQVAAVPKIGGKS